METPTQTSQSVSGTDYASALNQYRKYSRGRSMRQFYEDEGYDYNKFCKYAREVEKKLGVKRTFHINRGVAGAVGASPFRWICPDKGNRLLWTVW